MSQIPITLENKPTALNPEDETSVLDPDPDPLDPRVFLASRIRLWIRILLSSCKNM
jgi:hypothetical protein